MQKNAVLRTLANLLLKNKQEIININQQDVIACGDNTDESLLDRLKVDNKKVEGMIASINQTIELEDPEGKLLYFHQHQNGLKIENKTVPFGKILIIYESRPDVTIEAAILAFKAGSKILLKGGKEAKKTNKLLVDLWQQALITNGVSQDFVQYLDFSREQTQALIKDNTHQVDLIIPRGGEWLINFVADNTDIPVIISGRGNNFLYVDQESDWEMAIDIMINGKQRISVCNALDKVLINQNIPDLETKINKLISRLKEKGIEVLGDNTIKDFNNNIWEITGDNVWGEEFLAAKILLSLAWDIEEAIEKINKYSGGHSASIVTTNQEIATKFQMEVDCAAVYHNASTRFTDGGQLGMGAEMAISTQKLHFRGPIGLDQLVTNKWFICGEGQVR